MSDNTVDATTAAADATAVTQRPVAAHSSSSGSVHQQQTGLVGPVVVLFPSPSVAALLTGTGISWLRPPPAVAPAHAEGDASVYHSSTTRLAIVEAEVHGTRKAKALVAEASLALQPNRSGNEAQLRDGAHGLRSTSSP
jgi:hypothetical protein